MLSAAAPALARYQDAARAARLVLDHLAAVGPDRDDLTTVLANQALIVLVTGFETYCERRFVELVVAGWPVATDHMDRVLVPANKQGALAVVPPDLDRRSEDYARLLIRRYRVNFQAYRNTQRAYASAFGIHFGALATSNDLLAMQRLLEFRHGAVHVSPFFAALDDSRGPPLHAGAALASDALAVFGRFIAALAERTETAGR